MFMVQGFTVQRFKGSGFTVHGYFLHARLVFLEIVDKSANGGSRAPGLFVYILVFSRVNVLLVQGDIKFTLHFRAGAFGVSQEPGELRISHPFLSTELS